MARKRPEAPVAQRHVHYSPEIAQRLCEEMASGRSLTDVCEQPDMPDRRSVRRWVIQNEAFREMYTAARGWWADAIAEEIIEIGDAVKGSENNAAVQAARLAADNRKWVASRLLPGRWGDRQTTELVGAGGKDLLPEQPMDTQKIALFLLGIFNNLPGGKNDPARMTAALPVTAATTLLSGSPEPAEPPAEPVRVPEPLTRLGEHPIFDQRSGQQIRPVFDAQSGRVLRFVSGTGEQAR
jgi:hypothetical protein